MEKKMLIREDKCDECKKETPCHFGMHGDEVVAYFCSVDCMVRYAKKKDYIPFGGRLNVRSRN